MNTSEFQISGREIRQIVSGEPEALLLQPVDEHDAEGLEAEAAYLAAHTERPFALCGIRVRNWNAELSPWKAPPVFGTEGFSGGAEPFLREIEHDLLPALDRWDLAARGAVFLGGYSLAGLFALWCGYVSDCFQGIAAASPSVWFPGWIDFAENGSFRAKRAALSLGDKEARTRNAVMARVADCIEAQQGLLEREGVPSSLVWNPGNHFREPEIRTAKAFLELLQSTL